MNHPEELLAGYVDGALSEADRATVEAHLESCASCRQEVDLAREAVGALAALPREAAPAGLAESVSEAAATGSDGAKAPRRYRIVAVLAAAAVVALIAITLPHLGGSNQTKDQAAGEKTGSQQGGSARGAAGNAPPLEISSVNYDSMTAGGLIKADASNEPAAAPGSTSFGGVGARTASPIQAQAALACLEKAFAGFTGDPTRLIQARFQGRPAYIGIYTDSPGSGLPASGVSVRVASTDTCIPLTLTSART